MTPEQYYILKTELQQIVKQLLYVQWGKVQNNATDARLNIFSISSFSQLEKEIENFEEPLRNYFKKRWFIYKCSICDEYLFSIQKNVQSNFFSKDKNYDIKINNNLPFDIKGTVIPKAFRSDIKSIIQNPTQLIHFFYEQQSKGVRYGEQNRLFIVHHSFKHQNREMMLRCHFDFKQQVYKQYIQHINSEPQLLQYKTVISDVVFIIENLNGSFDYSFASKPQ